MPVSKIIDANPTKDGVAIVGVTQGGDYSNMKYDGQAVNPENSIESLNSKYANPTYPRFSIQHNKYNG